MSSLSVGLNLNPGGKSKLSFSITHSHTHTEEALQIKPEKALLRNYLRKKDTHSLFVTTVFSIRTILYIFIYLYIF